MSEEINDAKEGLNDAEMVKHLMCLHLNVENTHSTNNYNKTQQKNNVTIVG